MLVKVCKKCGIEKSLEEFKKDSKMTGGHLNQCKRCELDSYNERRAQKNPELIWKRKLQEKNSKLLIVGMRFCVDCMQEKNLEEFGKNPAMKDGYKNECKKCITKIVNERRAQKNPELIQKRELVEKQSKLLIVEMCFCTKCEQEKPLEEFGRYYWCKECFQKYQNGWRAQNIEQCRETNRKWISENYESYREKTNNRKRARWIEDPKYRTIQLLRTGLNGAFHRYSKNGKVMSSKKYGIDYNAIFEKVGPRPEDGYELDHIIPISIFDLDNPEHVRLCHVPENFQWLPAFDNGSKSDSIYFDLIEANPRLSEIFQKLMDNQEEEV